MEFVHIWIGKDSALRAPGRMKNRLCLIILGTLGTADYTWDSLADQNEPLWFCDDSAVTTPLFAARTDTATLISIPSGSAQGICQQKLNIDKNVGIAAWRTATRHPPFSMYSGMDRRGATQRLDSHQKHVLTASIWIHLRKRHPHWPQE